MPPSLPPISSTELQAPAAKPIHHCWALNSYPNVTLRTETASQPQKLFLKIYMLFRTPPFFVPEAALGPQNCYALCTEYE